MRVDGESKAAHARTIPLLRAIRWRWHLDPDPRVRLAMASRLPEESPELAVLLYDSNDQVCAMAYERSARANYAQACLDERWLVRQVGVAKTDNANFVRQALKDVNEFVRATAERRMYGRGAAFAGRLLAVMA